MGSTKLKEDLSNSLINFDRRVLITELLDEYNMSYEDVDSVVKNFIEEQEKNDKIKYDKRFIVHGGQDGEQKKEVYKIVAENKLQEWLKKLKNAESALYSVEVAGGAKSAAPLFKPMSIAKDVKLRVCFGNIASTINGKPESTKASTEVKKKEIKPEKESPKKFVEGTAKPSTSANKSSPKSPPKSTITSEQKVTSKKANNKKDIRNFFAAKTSEDCKKAGGASNVSTVKNMKDLFTKPTETPKSFKEFLRNPKPDTSAQLFEVKELENEDSLDEKPENEDSSDKEPENEDTLDEEAILEKDLSDVEMNTVEDSKPTISKRRRILDSDDEQEKDSPVKNDKDDIVKEESKQEAPETYLDEEGFVITKVTKPKTSATNKKSPSKKKSVSFESSSTETKKSTTTAVKTPAKTKQGKLSSFFKKT